MSNRQVTAVLTDSVAQQAVESILPTIQQMDEQGLIDNHGFHVVVVDPTTSLQDYADQHQWQNGFGYNKSAILYEEEFDRMSWKNSYDRIARSKAYLSHRYGLSTHQIQTQHPYLLVDEDTTYYGSVYQAGLVVAVSGFKPYFDEMFAACILAACRAFSIEKMDSHSLYTTSEGFIQSEDAYR